MSVTETQAKKIMGKQNMLTIQEIKRFLNSKMDSQSFDKLQNVPFSIEFLEKYKKTHVLVPGLPISLEDMHELFSEEFGAKTSSSIIWYCAEDFFKQKLELGWYLCRRQAVPGTHQKPFLEQLRVLEKPEKIPSVCALCYTIILYWHIRHKRLFCEQAVRCLDMDRSANRIKISNSSLEITIAVVSDDYISPKLGTGGCIFESSK